MNYKEIIFYSLYTLFIIFQIISTSFIIYHKNEYNFTYDECKDSQNIFDSIISIAIGMLSTAICIFVSFVMYYISYRFINESDEHLNLLHNNRHNNRHINLIKEIKQNIYNKFNMILLIIFVLSVLSFIILNGVQFVYQLNNIKDSCLNKINHDIQGFYGIYKLMLTTAFFSSYALFFIVPAVII